MSLDGNAQITPNTDNQISPPKFRQNATAISLGRVGGLKRSQSAITLGEAEPSVLPKLFSDFSRRSSIGRSRDSRTWEFYCDGDSRDALTAQAERENSGSAAGAISLIRSRSNTALQSSNNRNLKSIKFETTRNKKSSSQAHRKSKLGRTASSLGRLQSNQVNIMLGNSNGANKTSKLSKEESALGSPTGDSDKENWLPGTQVSQTSRRQEQHGKGGLKSILGENRHVISQSSGLEAFLVEDKRRARKLRVSSDENKENADEADEDDEVGTFMRGSRRSAGGEDFDCVQGLLSLSQGAWR